MRFIAPDDVPASSSAAVFRVSGKRILILAPALLIFAAAFFVCAACNIFHDILATIACVVAGVIGLGFACLSWWSYRLTRSADLWVCKADRERLWLRCSHFFAERPSAEIRVLELNRSEIGWMQPLRIHSVSGGRGLDGAGYYSCLNISLSAAGQAALNALANDPRIEPRHREILFPSPYIPEQPVQRMKDGSIRVYWGNPISSVSPDVETAADYFSKWTTVRPLLREKTVLGVD